MEGSLKQLPGLVVVEYPGAVCNVDRALKTLGGEEAIARAARLKGSFLECRFRPDDPLSRPLFAGLSKAPGLLVKISKKPGAGNEGNPPIQHSNEPNLASQPESASQEPPGRQGNNPVPTNEVFPGNGFEVRILGVVQEAFRFEGMADFQVVPDSESFSAAKRLRADSILQQELDEFLAHEQPMLAVPPMLSREDLPGSYLFRDKTRPWPPPSATTKSFPRAGVKPPQGAGAKAPTEATKATGSSAGPSQPPTQAGTSPPTGAGATLAPLGLQPTLAAGSIPAAVPSHAAAAPRVVPALGRPPSPPMGIAVASSELPVAQASSGQPPAVDGPSSLIAGVTAPVEERVTVGEEARLNRDLAGVQGLSAGGGVQGAQGAGIPATMGGEGQLAEGMGSNAGGAAQPMLSGVMGVGDASVTFALSELASERLITEDEIRGAARQVDAFLDKGQLETMGAVQDVLGQHGDIAERPA